MSTRYRVQAYSRRLNQTQQRMDLTNDPLLADQAYAQKVANSFAQVLNQQQSSHTADWQGRVSAYEHRA
jgi:hypothetical protein